MWLLLSGVLLVLALVSTALPVPLWTARALRGRPAQLALPPASDGDALSRLAATAPRLADVLQQGRVLRMEVARFREAARDYAVARPWALLRVWMLSNQQDGWAEDTAAELEQRSVEVTRLVFEWVRAARELTPAEQETLGVDLEALARAVQATDDESGFRGRSSAEVRAEVERLAGVAEELAKAEGRVLAEGGSPYR